MASEPKEPVEILKAMLFEESPCPEAHEERKQLVSPRVQVACGKQTREICRSIRVLGTAVERHGKGHAGKVAESLMLQHTGIHDITETPSLPSPPSLFEFTSSDGVPPDSDRLCSGSFALTRA